MRAAAILLAAGSGERLRGDRPKALVEVGGITLLDRAIRTIEAVPEIEGFLVAAPPGKEEEMRASAAGSTRFLAVAPGGGSRQGSVRLALETLPPGFDAVVCHDVARPFASPGLFSAVLGALEGVEGAIPVVPVADTVKRFAAGLVVETVSRQDLGLAQTPQAFLRESLERAHEVAEADGAVATDDAALLERAGMRVAVVPGEPENMKVTAPEDLERAEALARSLTEGRP
ncbi:MAG TPA: 2-C-methyl-D-erythritol 4-phosphate cytidylyltransferase [Actinomycetota bacterium]|nr:2-C-methyl-D-erythritol 4-phosphate cytidylyltransferase [Actinomycetota bacterium]